jgi:hypothetical protein
MHSSDTLENVKREYKLIFENKYETNDADKWILQAKSHNWVS